MRQPRQGAASVLRVLALLASPLVLVPQTPVAGGSGCATVDEPAAAASPAGEWTCVPEGRRCTFGSDCCSKNCVSDPKLGKVCKPPGASWTCVPEGRQCTFGSDCCSKHCVSDPKLGKVCKPPGASWTCVPKGRACTFDSDCCSRNCVGDPKLGKVCKGLERAAHGLRR